MKRKLKALAMEEWRSKDNKEEIHFFKKGDRNTYLFGYNPKYVDPAKAKRLLKSIKR